MRIAVAFRMTAVLMALAAAPAMAQVGREDCVKLLEQRQKVVQELNKLDGVTLPSDRVKELKSVIEELKTALSGTSTDAKDVADKIDKAIEKVKPVLPALEKPLKQVSKGLKDAKSKIGDVLKVVEKIGSVLDELDRNFQTLEAGSAEQQVRDLGRAFDTIKGSLPNVPGISDLLDVYSRAISAIADSVAKIEAAVQQANDTMRELQKTAGDDIGIAPVYIKAEGPRANLAKQKLALQKMLDALDAKLDDLKCQRPGSPYTPDYSDNSCPQGKVRAAVEIAKREVARRELERKLDEAVARRPEVQGDVALAKAKSDAHKLLLEQDHRAIENADKTVVELETALRRERYEEQMAPDEKTANEHRINRIKLEEVDLPRARKGPAGARAKLAEDEMKSPQVERALTTATQAESRLEDEIDDIRRQIGEVIRNTLAQAAAADKWDDVDYGTLLLCRDKLSVNDRIKSEFTKDKIEAARKDRECPPASAPPAGGGFVGQMGRVNNQIDAAGCR